MALGSRSDAPIAALAQPPLRWLSMSQPVQKQGMVLCWQCTTGSSSLDHCCQPPRRVATEETHVQGIPHHPDAKAQEK